MCAAFDPSPWVLPASVLNTLIEAIVDVVKGEQCQDDDELGAALLPALS
jgi:hypothetical protein